MVSVFLKTDKNDIREYAEDFRSKRFSIGEKLPPLGQEGKGGEALVTFLKRRKYWKQLKEVVNATKKSFKTLLI